MYITETIAVYLALHQLHRLSGVIHVMYAAIKSCLERVSQGSPLSLSRIGMIKTLRTLIILKKGVRFTDKIIVVL